MNVHIKKLIISILFLNLLAISNKEFAQNKVVTNVKVFGAKGDGKTDDYSALLKVVNYINNKGKGEVYFPEGNYFISQFHDGKNNISDLQFQNCNGLKIYGSHAVISVNGHFNRFVTYEDSKHKKNSSVSAIIPLIINNCKNVTVENLEFNGNVNQMTRDSGVMESGGSLLMIIESENININNLFLHNAQTDGIYIRGSNTKNVVGEKIISSNNARQGMSIIELMNGTFTSCKFINTGITGGQYGRHAPSAGVDIEPNNVKQKVSNIRFISCLFENNLGYQFVCSSPATTKDIFLNNCTLNANTNSIAYSVVANAVNVVFKNCSFDCKNGSIYPVWSEDSSSSFFKNCNIKSNISGFIAVHSIDNCKVSIDKCNLQYTGTQKIGSFFPYIKMQNLSFTNNSIKIPKQYYKPLGSSSLIESAKDNSGNTFENN